MAVTPAEEQELRTQFQIVLRANRELGPDYERAAVDPLLEKVRSTAHGPAAAVPPVGGGRRGRRSPWAALGVLLALSWLLAAALTLAVLLVLGLCPAALGWAARGWCPRRRWEG